METKGHLGPKKSKVAFCGNHDNYLVTVGYNKMAKRELALWDLRNLEKRA